MQIAAAPRRALTHTHTEAVLGSRVPFIPQLPLAACELRERCCGFNAATIGVTVCEPNRSRWLQPLAPLRSQPCPHNLGSPAAWHCQRALLLPLCPAGSFSRSRKLERKQAGGNDGDVFDESSTGSNLKSVSYSVRWKGHLVWAGKEANSQLCCFGCYSFHVHS